MSSTAKKDLQQMIKRFETRKGDGKYDTAADAAISIAESYNDIGDPENAYKYYEDAKECLTNISEKSYKVLYNEFLAYRRSFEMFCLIETNEKKIKEALTTFTNYVKENQSDPSCKQIALHIASHTYLQYLKGEKNHLETAKSLGLSSLKYLEKYSQQIDENLKKHYNDKHLFEGDDSKRRRAGQYQLLASISADQGDPKAAEEYCNKVLEFERLEKDHPFHFITLSTKRDHVPPERQYEVSKKMLEVLGKMGVKERQKHLLETLSLYANDCLIHKDFEEAGRNFWKICSHEKCRGDRGFKEEAKNMLIKLYKHRLRLSEVKKLENAEPLDYRKMAKMYEKIADFLCEIGAHELAIDFYMKMKNAAALLPGDPEFGDLEISRAAILSIAQTYGNDLSEYEKASEFYEKLLYIHRRLNSPKALLAEIRLDIVLVNSHRPFDEQKRAFAEVDMPKDNVKLYIKYLEEYIEFLEENKNREGVSDCLNNLKTELLKYQKIQNDSQEIPDTTSSQDQYDILKDDEVFEEIEKYYKLEDKAEKEKEKIESKDKFGETSLHRAAKESLEEVKFLIERCGAKAVINARDHSNWTPLSEAVNHGHVDIVQYLIQNGADMNTLSTEQPMKSDDDECTGESWSPLMEACYNGYFKMIHILIAKGANPCLMNANGWTAADFLEVFIKSPFMEKSEAVKFGYFLKHLREREARDETIKNREKKSNSSNEKPKKEIPKLHVRKREKGGGELFQEVIAFTARPNRQTANQMFREYIIKEDEDDEMFEDDEKFIAPESDDDDGDEEMNNENYKGEDSDEAMEIDDEKFRQNNGFFGSTKMNNRKKAKRASTPKQKLKRNSSRNDLDEDVVVLSQDSVEEVEEIRLKKTRKSKSEALKRRSSNRSFESSSSKKTKRSESISNDSEILSISKMVDMNSLSLTQQQQPLPPRLNVKAKELDFSFSKDVTEVSETIKLHLNLKKLFLKGSDFDDDEIGEVVEAIRRCENLVELDLSQVEQIESIHANKILKSCPKLKILDLYGTSVNVIDLQKEYKLEKLIIAKTPFEYSDGFYQQINDLKSLSFLDVSLTSIDMNLLLSTISLTRSKLSIKASPIFSHVNFNQILTQLSQFTMGQIILKFPRNTKLELLALNPELKNFLD